MHRVAGMAKIGNWLRNVLYVWIQPNTTGWLHSKCLLCAGKGAFYAYV